MKHQPQYLWEGGILQKNNGKDVWSQNMLGEWGAVHALWE